MVAQKRPLKQSRGMTVEHRSQSNKTVLDGWSGIRRLRSGFIVDGRRWSPLGVASANLPVPNSSTDNVSAAAPVGSILRAELLQFPLAVSAETASTYFPTSCAAAQTRR